MILTKELIAKTLMSEDKENKRKQKRRQLQEEKQEQEHEFNYLTNLNLFFHTDPICQQPTPLEKTIIRLDEITKLLRNYYVAKRQETIPILLHIWPLIGEMKRSKLSEDDKLRLREKIEPLWELGIMDDYMFGSTTLNEEEQSNKKRCMDILNSLINLSEPKENSCCLCM
jgi:hypothetical protein